MSRVNSLKKKHKNLDRSKSNAFAEDKLNVTLIVEFVFNVVENIVGEAENTESIACSSFPKMLSICFFSKVVKNQNCVAEK